MSLKEQAYSILLVSATGTFAPAFTGMFANSRYGDIQTVTSISAAKRRLSEKTYDFVVINSPLPDDPGTRFAIDTSRGIKTVVLLLVHTDIHDEVHDKVAEHGVFTLAKPASKATIFQAMSWMESARERLRQFEKKSLSLDEKMAEIRLVNKAKWFLISELKMTEPDAHRYIEKQAMDNCAPKREIAENILKTYS